MIKISPSRNLISWIWLGVMIFAPSLFCQPKRVAFDHLDTEKGLSNNYARCIISDSKGFIWIGTEDGLNRYDGHGFKVYKHDPAIPNSLSGNHIHSLFEDHQGILWVGTWLGGLNCFDRQSETFQRFQHDPNIPASLSHNEVVDIYEDHSKVLWIATYDGKLNRFDRDTKTFRHFGYDPQNPQSLYGEMVFDLHESPGQPNVLWVGTNWGLNRFDLGSETFKHFKPDPQNPQSLSYREVYAIYEDKTGTLWIGTYGGGLNYFDRESETFQHFMHDPQDPRSLSNNYVRTIFEDHTGMLWVGTQEGLNLFDRNNALFKRIKYDSYNLEGLSNNVIYSIYEDRSGALWMGTYGGGVNRFERQRSVFQHFAHNTHNPQSLSTNTIYALYEDRQGSLWVGTESGGLNKFDRKSGTFYTFKHDRENPQSLSANTIYSLREDLQGTLWIGTSGPIGGLNRFDRENETFRHFEVKRHDPTTLSSRTIFSLCVDRSGVLWIGTFDKGLNRYERQTQTFKRYQHDPRNPISLSTNTIYSIYEDSQGIMWVGTLNGGLNRFDREKEEFYPFKHDPENPETLSNNTILCIYEDRSGVLWLGTDGGGLNRFDRGREVFFAYGIADGLPHLSINGILEDNQGNLWLSTGNGISRFNPRNKIFKNYDISDGLQSNTFNFGAFCKSRNGEMIFGGINGFNIFNPEDIKDNLFVPPIVFTVFKRYSTEAPGEKAIEDKGIPEREKIELSYKNNILTFEFAALSFQQPAKNQYAYKLEGFNDHWIELGTKHDVTLTNLDPGNYTLYVKGSNNDGVWNEEGASLKITILPPWWKTWWAYTFYVLFALGLLYGARRYELSRQRFKHEFEMEHLEKEKVQEVERMKSRFFANISHEFRTPLTLIQGPLRQLRSGEFKGNLKEQYDLILRNCNRLLRLVNQLLDLSKLESGSMKLQTRPENIVELTRQLTMAFESLAKRKGIDLSFQAPDQDITVYIDRDKFEKIVANLLSNAFKFTGTGGSVEVVVSLPTPNPSQEGIPGVPLLGGDKGVGHSAANTEPVVEIAVRDSGIGIPAEHLPHIFERFFQVNDFGEGETLYATSRQGTGIGLALTKELVELHHGKILVTSEVGKGTTFIVRLPLGKEHLKPEQIVEIGGGEITAGAKHPLQSIESHTEEFAGDASPLHYQSSNRQITQSPNILIVEDNPDMRAYIHNSLKNKYRIAEAEDGAEGFKTALKAAPNLIISDVMMPKMDGYQFCEKIKTDPRTSHIPVILLTAKASRDSKLEGLETGADDYLTKPFDAEELQVRIKNLIEQRRKLRELFQRELKVEPQDITVTSADEKFLRRAMEVVEEHIGDSEFDTVKFSRKIGIGRSQLNVKLRALTGDSTREFIRTLRLKRAAQLLQQRFGNVAEVAYEVGFSSLSHFSKAFKEQFGVLPSEYKSN